MRYVMKSGTLYRESERALGKIKGVFSGSEKNVFLPDGSLALKTLIRELDAPQERRANVRSHTFVMLDAGGAELAIARPDYAEGDDPEIVGWPISRMPRVDHAAVTLGDRAYTLIMQNSQNYMLRDAHGHTALQIMHRGLMGGWNLDADGDFSPAVLCGLFAFCRYMEQENELLVV